MGLGNAVYALDASTIDLRLSVLSVGIVSLNQKGNIPIFIHISDGKLHDVNVLDLLIPEPGAFYIMDRGHLHKTVRFFVIRAKSNTKIQASLLSSRGRIRWWCSMRSDHCAERSQVRA